jgi:hypothetical protein
MIPKRFAPYVFALLLAGVMTFVVSGIVTMLNVGLPPDFVGRWFGSWLTTWMIAYPVLLMVRPAVQKVVERISA